MGIKNNIIIGITIGDPAGIGPEISLKAINKINERNLIPLLIGSFKFLKNHYDSIFSNYIIINENDAADHKFRSGKKYLIDISANDANYSPGSGNIAAGIDSKNYIDKSIELWKRGIVNAIVTGPVNKGYINKSGVNFSGHTEYIANLINEKNPYMMMYSKTYRVLLVTTHIPLSEISSKVDEKILYDTILAGCKFIRQMDGDDVSIAIAGLDPHCGDKGAIGDFDMNVTAEAVRKARKDGVNIHGPFAADTLFTPNKWKLYNLAIAQYHDQGLIPFKALAFDTGVNITFGLSIIRTSPDHGTAYDIAGKDVADHRSMLEAIKTAYQLAKNKETRVS